MLFFGYIITDIKYNDLEEDIVKVVTNINECEKPLPKLIVGLDNAKQYAKDNNLYFNILEHTYSNGDMWTFKKTEKREFYEEDLKNFKKKIVESHGIDVNYCYINTYALKYSEFKRLYNIMMNNLINYIIVDRDMFYLSLNEKDVIGISFNHLKYIGIDRQKIIDKLKKGYNNKIYYTTSKNMWKLKDWFNGREYVIANIFKKNAIKRN